MPFIDDIWSRKYSSSLGFNKTAEFAREMECASCGDPMFYSMARDNDPPSPTTPRCEECKKPIHQQCSAIRPGLLCFQCADMWSRKTSSVPEQFRIEHENLNEALQNSYDAADEMIGRFKNSLDDTPGRNVSDLAARVQGITDANQTSHRQKIDELVESIRRNESYDPQPYKKVNKTSMLNLRSASNDHESTDHYIKRHADLAQESYKNRDYDRMNSHIAAARAHWVYRNNQDEGSGQLADYLSQIANEHRHWENPNTNSVSSLSDVREQGSILPEILESIKPKNASVKIAAGTGDAVQHVLRTIGTAILNHSNITDHITDSHWGHSKKAFNILSKYHNAYAMGNTAENVVNYFRNQPKNKLDEEISARHSKLAEQHARLTRDIDDILKMRAIGTPDRKLEAETAYDGTLAALRSAGMIGIRVPTPFTDFFSHKKDQVMNNFTPEARQEQTCEHGVPLADVMNDAACPQCFNEANAHDDDTAYEISDIDFM